MRKSHKSRLQIIVAILEFCKNSFKLKTYILYEIKTITHGTLSEILDILLKNELIEKKSKFKKPCFGGEPRYALSNKPRTVPKHLYKTTKKGRIFLKKYRDLIQMFSLEELVQ